MLWRLVNMARHGASPALASTALRHDYVTSERMLKDWLASWRFPRLHP